MKTKINLTLTIILIVFCSCEDKNQDQIDKYFFTSDTNVANTDTTKNNEPINLEINGVWKNSDEKITISGSTGVFTEMYSNDNLKAKNLGIINIGSDKITNISKINSLTWSCSYLKIDLTNSYFPTSWGNGTITMSSDGKTFTVSFAYSYQTKYTYGRVE